MFIRALNVDFKPDTIIEAEFQDGLIIQYDISVLFDKFPQFLELKKNKLLFYAGRLDIGGLGIYWNDDLDLDIMEIYYEGKVVGEKEITFNQHVATFIIKERNRQGLTQTQLSKLSGVDQGDISKIELGIANPTVNKIEKILKALNVRYDIVAKHRANKEEFKKIAK